MKFSIIILLIQVFTCSFAQAQSTVDKAKYTLLPLRTHNVNAETRSRLQKELKREWQGLREALLPGAVKLSSTIKNITLNNKRMSQNIWVSNQNSYTSSSTRSLIFEPVWCHMFNQDLMFLQVLDRDLATLVASHHIVFNQGNKTPYKKRIDALKSKFSGLHRRLLSNKKVLNDTKTINALHLQVQSRRQSDWKKVAPPECVTMLIEESLYNKVTLVRSGGLQLVQAVRQNLGKFAGLRRPTRNLHFAWPDRIGQNIYEFSSKVTASEGPFGQPYPGPGVMQIRLKAAREGIKIELPEALMSHLQQEEEMLALNDAPRIIRLYGAWAYLDKGRAWGLKMRDRLVVRNQTNEIQGHVVRYFGAELGLKDSEGRLVKEGAIVYIRKGQNKTRLGQAFDFDPKLYPAAWR